MNFSDTKEHITHSLSNIYPSNEINNFIKIIFEKILNINFNIFLTEPEQLLTKEQEKKFIETVSQLKKNIPIQYITGFTEFYGLDFYVNKNVLIPRPETEELVDFILQNYDLTYKNILDIGTGSGCIAVSIAKNSQADVFATDISKSAIEIAKKNAVRNNADVTFVLHDILTQSPIIVNNSEIFFDIIISNPPYVRNSEKKLMQKNVLDYEPHTALFVDDNDPLIFYKAILNFAEKYLKKNGKIFLEINEFLPDETLQLFNNQIFTKFLTKKDLSNKKRFIIAEK